MIKKLHSKVVRVQTLDNLNVVSFELQGQILTMVSLDLNKEIKIGVDVLLHVKPTAVAIAKDFQGELSYSNQLQAKILSSDNGELLSSIILGIGDVRMESIITLSSSRRMNLNIGDEVTALIKANEISIAEVYDD